MLDSESTPNSSTTAMHVDVIAGAQLDVTVVTHERYALARG